MKKRILAWILVVLMAVSLMPEAAFAAEPSASAGEGAASGEDITVSYTVLKESCVPDVLKKALEEKELTAPDNPEQTDYIKVLEATQGYLLSRTPGVGSAGGEWLVLGLARSGAELCGKYRNE